MAHIEKYTAAATGHMLAHYDRTHSSSTSLIDESRTALNHNLAGIDQPLPQLDFLHKRLGEIKVMKRADVNVMCDWIVTAPKELTPEELPLFFNETFKFLNNRYGKENVISAYVHMDETTPHIHYAFVPVVIDKKKGIPKLSAKERITRKDLNTFHPDLTKHMRAVFGRDIGIQNDATALGNQTIKQLRQKTKNMEKFKAEPVPVTEIPPVVKKFLKEDKVIISRKELDRVNQAAEDAALIMSNAEAVNAQLAEKAAKTDNNYKKSEEHLSKAHQQADTIISDAQKNAESISAAISADKATWEQQRSIQQAELDERDRMQNRRAERLRKEQLRNDDKAKSNNKLAAELNSAAKELDEKVREFKSIKDSPQEYYEQQLHDLSSELETYEASNKLLRRDIADRDGTIKNLRQQIIDENAAHNAVIENLKHESEQKLEYELESKVTAVTAKYQSIIKSKDNEINKLKKVTDRLKGLLDKAYRVIRDICMGIATLVCGKGKYEAYCIDLDDKPFTLIEAMLNVGEKSAEEAGFQEYAEEIKTAYGIYPLVKEELDIIDPPKSVHSHSSYEK